MINETADHENAITDDTTAITDNSSMVDTYETVNTDLVEGYWYSSETDHPDETHATLFKTGWNSASPSLDKYQYYAFMYGATFNDTKNSGVQGMTAHPQWHGYFKNGTKDNNYVTCYIYLTRVANALYQGKTSVSRPSTMTDDEYNGMKNVITSSGVGSLTWAQICSKASANGYTVSNLPKNRMAFVYGMALHTATDVFSHSTFRYTNGGYTRITHAGSYYADYKSTIPARWSVAERVAYRVVNRCASQTQSSVATGTVFDFQVPNSYFGAPDFRIASFYAYAGGCGCPQMYTKYESSYKYPDLESYCDANGITYNYNLTVKDE